MEGSLYKAKIDLIWHHKYVHKIPSSYARFFNVNVSATLPSSPLVHLHVSSVSLSTVSFPNP